LEPNSYLWEHIDYCEFTDKKRVRLHIPIVTNRHAEIVFSDRAIHLNSDHVWLLDPKGIHGASNRGHTERIHILLDCRVNLKINNLMHHSMTIPISDIRILPQPTDHGLNTVIQTAACLMRAGYHTEGEHVVLKLFHNFHLPDGGSLAIIAAIYQRLGDDERSRIWREKAKIFLGGVPA
jgi:hypothetical protein